MASNYGRGRAGKGKIHAKDAAGKLWTLCGSNGDMRVTDVTIVNCKHCLAKLAKEKDSK